MERREPTIEDLLSKIKLLEKTLEYYANKKMYSGNIEKMNILKDRGHQARFALDQIKEIAEYEDDLVKNLKEVLDGNEDISEEEKIKALENMQKITASIDKFNNTKK